MTMNQIRRQELLETVRANKAREHETNRSNLAKEAENNRSNVAREEETHRSNVTNEDFTRSRTQSAVARDTTQNVKDIFSLVTNTLESPLKGFNYVASGLNKLFS